MLDGGDAQALARGWQPDSQTLLKDMVCTQNLLAHAGTGGLTRQFSSSLFFVLPAVNKSITTRVDAFDQEKEREREIRML